MQDLVARCFAEEDGFIAAVKRGEAAFHAAEDLDRICAWIERDVLLSRGASYIYIPPLTASTWPVI